MSNADIGIIGLGVMGENLALNFASRGYTVAVFNRTISKVEEFVTGRAAGKNVIGARTLPEFCRLLRRPRKALLMVKAGAAIDELIDQLLPHLEAGDIIIDGGNTHFADTIRRTRYVEQQGKLFVGTGISGGEEGALRGPAIMPGGSAAAWPHLKPLFQAIAARTSDGVPCCDWIGPDGAGHFVKMVHNGIEYGDMQLICEAYHFMKTGLGLTLEAMSTVFDEWNQRELSSYLIEITRDILAYRDKGGTPVVELILDAAGQKGTGQWTVKAALEFGQPLTLIAEAVFARCLSALKDERVAAARVLGGSIARCPDDPRQALEDLRAALYAAKIVSYAQGYQLLRAAAHAYGWDLDYGRIALLWRAGCIIRSAFLDRIQEAFRRTPQLVNLLLDPFFQDAVRRAEPAWRRTVVRAVTVGLPIPALSAALAYFDAYRCERLPANLLQAQRDYFGAHLYERIDRPRGEFFHTNWTGRGGPTASTPYTV